MYDPLKFPLERVVVAAVTLILCFMLILALSKKEPYVKSPFWIPTTTTTDQGMIET